MCSRNMLSACLFLFLLFSSVSSVEVGKVLYEDSPEGIQNTGTITVPYNAVALSEYVYMESPDTTEAGSAPSIMFVIDNSGSMEYTGKDPDGNRFSVVQDLIDSISVINGAEVGIAVFQQKLTYNESMPAVQELLSLGADTNQSGGYVPLIKLDSSYGGAPGKSLLKNYLNTIRIDDSNDGNTPDTIAVLTDNLISSEAGNRGTNINIGMLAVQEAMSKTSNQKKNQYVIFLSDGDATQNWPMNNDDDFVSFTNIPTTFTIYFTSDNTVPNSIQQFTDNVVAMGTSTNPNYYSETNQQSEAFPYANSSKDSTLAFIMDKVISKIIGNIVTAPAKVTINSVVRVTTWIDSTQQALLDGGPVPFETDPQAFTYNFLFETTYDTLNGADTVTVVETSNEVYSFNVDIDPSIISPSGKVSMTYWDRNIELRNGTAVISKVDTNHQSVEISFDFSPGDANYSYTNATVKVTTSAGDVENVTLTKVVGENRFAATVPLLTLQDAATATVAGTIEHYVTDDITLFFQNTEETQLPLDTLSYSVPVDKYVTTNVDTTDDTTIIKDPDPEDSTTDTTYEFISNGAILYDNNADGYPDAISLRLSGANISGAVAELLAPTVRNTLLPSARYEITAEDSTNATVNGNIVTIPVHYKDSLVLKTSVDNQDVVQLSDSLKFGNFEVLLPFSLALTDSMAPVITAVDLDESTDTTLLSVTFSESVYGISHLVPFTFTRNSATYTANMIQTSHSGATAVFAVQSFNDQTIQLIENGDSISIKVDGALSVRDLQNVIQRNPENRREPIGVSRPHYFGGEAALFDKNADGIPDLLTVTIDGPRVTLIAQSIHEHLVVPGFITLSSGATVTGNTVSIPVIYNGTDLKTSLNGETVSLPDSTQMGSGGFLYADTVIISDSMAPVIVSAHLTDTAGDQLHVQFSESIATIDTTTPFNFFSFSGTQYGVEMASISQNGTEASFTVGTITGQELVNIGDSISIKDNGTKTVSDILSIQQTNSANRRVEITGTRTHTISSAALFDRNADGYPDELQVVANGVLLSQMTAGIDTIFTLPSFLEIASGSVLTDSLFTIPVNYVGTGYKTSLTNATVTVSNNTSFGIGGVLISNSVIIADSMAPVVTLASISEDVSNDVFDVSFSEEITAIDTTKPLIFVSRLGGGQYEVELTLVSQSASSATFTVSTGEIKIRDSVAIANIGTSTIGDLLGNTQLNAANHREPITGTRIHRITEATLYDTDANGLPDELVIQAEGVMLSDMADSIANVLTMPATLTISGAATVDGSVIRIPVNYVGTELFYTSLNGEVVTISESIEFIEGGIVQATSLSVIDAMAPVITKAVLIDSLYYKHQDHLEVTFSEVISDISHNDPFTFVSAGTEYVAYVSMAARDSLSIQFVTDSIVGVTSFGSNDSVWISTTASSSVRDVLGNSQTNANNRKVELETSVVHEYVSLSEAAFFDDNADGKLDRITVTFEGNYVEDHYADLITYLNLPLSREITIDSIPANQNSPFSIVVTSTLEKTTTDLDDEIVIDSTVTILPFGLTLQSGSVIPADSMAPVIISAGFLDSVTTSKQDVFTVIFSEPITSSVDMDVPFSLQLNDSTIIHPILTGSATDDPSILEFTLDPSENAYIDSDDTVLIWINTDASSSFTDNGETSQSNPENIKRPLVYDYIVDPFSLEFRSTQMMTDESAREYLSNIQGLSETINTISDSTSFIMMSVVSNPAERFYTKDNMSGFITVFDVVGNVVISNIPLVYDPEGRQLLAVWNGRNSADRTVGRGGYVAMVSVLFEPTDLPATEYTLRGMIYVDK